MSLSRIPLLVWFLIPTAILIVAGVWFFTKSDLGHNPSGEGDVSPAPVSQPIEGTQDFPIVGRTHVDFGTPVATYNSNPPSSGDHWPTPLKNGIYDTQQPDEQIVHNLEHGYIWISYKPQVSDEV